MKKLLVTDIRYQRSSWNTRRRHGLRTNRAELLACFPSHMVESANGEHLKGYRSSEPCSACIRTRAGRFAATSMGHSFFSNTSRASRSPEKGQTGTFRVHGEGEVRANSAAEANPSSPPHGESSQSTSRRPRQAVPLTEGKKSGAAWGSPHCEEGCEQE